MPGHRVDEYSVSRGERIDDFGPDRFGAVVRRICGTVSGLSLTFLETGRTRQIRVDSLFAFAQVSLLQAVRRLRAMNAEVKVVAIHR
ncbi:hypothetical protein ACXZ65_37235 [Streptomyces aculeolatus]